MLKKLKNLKLLTGDSTFSQLFRTYLVGAFNLVFSLVISYLFQFFIFYSINIPLRTYLTNVFAFSIGVIVSYFLSRKIIFRLPVYKGGISEFTKFLVTNLISLGGSRSGPGDFFVLAFCSTLSSAGELPK